MKKVGIVIFIAAVVSGVIIANMFSWGRVNTDFINISFGSKIKGSGNVVTESRSVKGFKSVDVGGVFVVEIAAQSDFSVEVVADDNLLPIIKTEVSGGTLKIDTKERFSTHNRIKIKIGAPDIEAIEVSGASHTTLKNLANEKLDVDSGGAAKLTIEGRTEELNIDMGGASRIDASGLTASKVFVDGGGASKVSVNVVDVLEADLGGASRVNYTGSPSQIKKKTSGGSSISQTN